MLSNGSSSNVDQDPNFMPNGGSMAARSQEVVNVVHKKKNAEQYKPPVFYQPFETELTLDEGEALRLVSQIGPADDSSLSVEWFKNGKSLCVGSRFSTLMDRGFIVLDIYYTIEEDSGEYYCVASSNSGKTESNKVQVRITPESGVPNQTDTIHNYQSLAGLEIEYCTTQVPDEDKHGTKMAPQFINQTSNTFTVSQGNPLQLEVSVEPVSDSSLIIDWYKDGKPLASGSRINTLYDRGYCSLGIAYCYPEDSGQYTCVAKNSLGTAESLPSTIICNPEDAIVTKSNLNESSIMNLKQFENPGDEYSLGQQQTEDPIGPNFQGEIQPNNVSVIEGEPVYFEVKVTPGNGEKLMFDWYHNDEVINTSSRLTGRIEMNVASLRIQYTMPSDTGTYKCVVFTEHGRAETQAVTLAVEAEHGIVSAPQSKGIQAIEALEAELNAPKLQSEQDDTITEAPSFDIQPKPVDQLNEGDSVLLSASVQPAKDNTLFVEWYKNDACLMNAARFHIEYERGIAKLNITSLIPEDSGLYYLVAKNRNGECISDKIEINCQAGVNVVTTSSLLEDSEGYRRIREMEEDLANANNIEFRNYEEEEVDSPPTFDVGPMNITVSEGCPAKFLVKVGGSPRPVLEWSMDGNVVLSDSICKTYNDGSINYLEINRCSELGESAIHVTATNSLGQAEADAVLTVVKTVNFMQELKHITPENPYKKMAGLKKVECTSELANAFKKSKPTAETISMMEKGELRSRIAKPQDVIETEKMYDQVASKLRKSSNHSRAGSRGRSPNHPAIANKSGANIEATSPAATATVNPTASVELANSNDQPAN